MENNKYINLKKKFLYISKDYNNSKETFFNSLLHVCLRVQKKMLHIQVS